MNTNSEAAVDPVQLQTSMLISIDELWLKGNNRGLYFKAAYRHISQVFKQFHAAPFQIKNEHNRLIVTSQVPFQSGLIDQLQRVAGIHNIAPCWFLGKEINETVPVLKQIFLSLDPKGKSFKVDTKRTIKNYPMTSVEIDTQLGGQLFMAFEHLNIRVNLKNPDIKISVRVTDSGFFAYAKEYAGMGGLPVGTSGHLMGLLSGGFDSPVAGHLMNRRGCHMSYIFFHAYPYVGDEVKDKIMKLVSHLAHFQTSTKIYIFPFGHLQAEISKVCKPGYRTLIYRKFMIQLADHIAFRMGLPALVTGDNLGQVASQTIYNLSALEVGRHIPILRPLIGFNKLEIIHWAKKIGTHDISVIPHDDACSLFAPKHPVTKPDFKYWQHFLNENTFTELIQELLPKVECHTLDMKGNLVQSSFPLVK
jgi:thiamine biosynthesis protein ThiI